MATEIQVWIDQVLGLDTSELLWWQMVVRALVVYTVVIVLVRLGNKRFMGENTAFDLVLGIILGSVVSRAITGNAPFGPTLAAVTVLVGLHWAFAALAFGTNLFGSWLKGQTRLLIQDSEFQWEAMRHSHITENDLREALRIQTQSTDLSRVKEARLERSGSLSFVLRRPPQIIEITVAEGVQTVRVELDSGR